ncbi:mannose-1-phosphate guanylyltransferase/mannose-6-phosphate isomerase [Prochlorococcus marinus]|uniref:mannose-1-phosphate guanylyltransferase/mannose-6-phosphate isomerase n=1 Tax=Prochlorococcus marinus TaxID=1219 RepID=UPI001FD8430F|nr:mannose-1-phosphate guanylyltransferase/mannose-6-phosphate isomerase [Prochlorococcus marinus]
MKEKEIKDINVTPIILSGGNGTRLWPVSRTAFPKQYLKMNPKSKYSLLQNTYLRLKDIKNLESPIIVCNEEQRFIVAEQMRVLNIDPQSIILEPFGKNTAPAIAIAALKILKEKKDRILLILPADHEIKNPIQFNKTINDGLNFAIKGRLVTFGILPTYPATGYGYIRASEEMSEDLNWSYIKGFIEKPSQDLAKELLKNSHYTWNSGIFLFKASTIVDELKKYHPKLINICKESLNESEKDFNFQRLNSKVFKRCPNISIDHAVMEKTNLGTVLRLDVGWNDLGSWKSIWEDTSFDKKRNSIKGKVFLKDVKNTYIRSESRLVAGLGLENLFIIETKDAILVANKNSINSVKELVEELRRNNMNETKINQKTYRPWGNFENLINETNWQVKKLEIKPKESISLQKHNFRSENWVVVEGQAKVEINGVISFLKKNEGIFIPLGSKHRLSNPGENILKIIEVQTGSYLGEDDIIRFEDKYKRGNN